MLTFFCLYQEYSEWKISAEDVSLPSPNIDHMDHLLSYLQVVTDSTQELCHLILSSNKLRICKSGECTLNSTHCTYTIERTASDLFFSRAANRCGRVYI